MSRPNSEENGVKSGHGHGHGRGHKTPWPVRLLGHVSVEPTIFLFSLSVGMVRTVNRGLLIERTCGVGSLIFSQNDATTYNATVCADLDRPDLSAAREHVHAQAARLKHLQVGLQAVLSIVFVLFAGAWSDRGGGGGRKAALLLPLIGFVLKDVVLFFVSMYPGLAPDYILLEALHDLTGGLPVVLFAAYSHVVDVASPQTRTTRMALAEASLLVGLFLGGKIGPALFAATAERPPIYIVSLVFLLSGILTVSLFVPDPMEEDQKTVHLGSLFRWLNVRASFGYTYRKRGSRTTLCLLLLAFLLLDVITLGERSLDSLYIQAKYVWASAEQYASWWAVFNAIFFAWGLFALVAMVPVLKQVYRLPDPCLIILSALGFLVRAVLFLTADERDNLYIGAFFDLFALLGGVAIRACVVALIEDTRHVGKVFAQLAVLQSLAALMAESYGSLFAATKAWFVGFVYVVNVAVLVAVILIGVWVWRFFGRNGMGWGWELEAGEDMTGRAEEHAGTMKRLSTISEPLEMEPARPARAVGVGVI